MVFDKPSCSFPNDEVLTMTQNYWKNHKF